MLRRWCPVLHGGLCRLGNARGIYGVSLREFSFRALTFRRQRLLEADGIPLPPFSLFHVDRALQTAEGKPPSSVTLVAASLARFGSRFGGYILTLGVVDCARGHGLAKAGCSACHCTGSQRLMGFWGSHFDCSPTGSSFCSAIFGRGSTLDTVNRMCLLKHTEQQLAAGPREMH